jgi:hypothetical protein
MRPSSKINLPKKYSRKNTHASRHGQPALSQSRSPFRHTKRHRGPHAVRWRSPSWSALRGARLAPDSSRYAGQFSRSKGSTAKDSPARNTATLAAEHGVAQRRSPRVACKKTRARSRQKARRLVRRKLKKAPRRPQAKAQRSTSKAHITNVHTPRANVALAILLMSKRARSSGPARGLFMLPVNIRKMLPLDLRREFHP